MKVIWEYLTNRKYISLRVSNLTRPTCVAYHKHQNYHQNKNFVMNACFEIWLMFPRKHKLPRQITIPFVERKEKKKEENWESDPYFTPNPPLLHTVLTLTYYGEVPQGSIILRSCCILRDVTWFSWTGLVILPPMQMIAHRMLSI